MDYAHLIATDDRPHKLSIKELEYRCLVDGLRCENAALRAHKKAMREGLQSVDRVLRNGAVQSMDAVDVLRLLDAIGSHAYLMAETDHDKYRESINRRDTQQAEENAQWLEQWEREEQVRLAQIEESTPNPGLPEAVIHVSTDA
jgi:hypothetical protein